MKNNDLPLVFHSSYGFTFVVNITDGEVHMNIADENIHNIFSIVISCEEARKLFEKIFELLNKYNESKEVI